MKRKSRYKYAPTTLFYVFEMFDNNGKWSKDVQIMKKSYREAVAMVKREYKEYYNHRLKNTNDPELLKLNIL